MARLEKSVLRFALPLLLAAVYLFAPGGISHSADTPELLRQRMYPRL